VAFLIWFFLDKGLLRDRETYVFEAIILVASAVITVFVLRLFWRAQENTSESNGE
jgi:hypothetical protein